MVRPFTYLKTTDFEAKEKSFWNTKRSLLLFQPEDFSIVLYILIRSEQSISQCLAHGIYSIFDEIKS